MMALGVTAILNAFSDNLIFFYTPTQLTEKRHTPDFDPARNLRIGGLVKKGSIVNHPSGGMSFTITDLKAEQKVTYKGMVPSLFREGQGVVAEGTLDNRGLLIADQILAKHDENYMPREVVEQLKASGRWQEGGEAK